MMLFRFLNSFFFLFLLFLSLLVIVTAGKAAAADSDRPTSSITSTNHDWFRTDNSTGSINISWEANDPNGDEIKRIYFWACYYYDVVESCDGKEKGNWIRIKRHDIIDNDPKVEVISIDYLIKYYVQYLNKY